MFNGNDFDAVQSALEYFEQQMLNRAKQALEMTMESTAMLHSQEAITNLVELLGDFGMKE